MTVPKVSFGNGNSEPRPLSFWVRVVKRPAAVVAPPKSELDRYDDLVYKLALHRQLEKGAKKMKLSAIWKVAKKFAWPVTAIIAVLVAILRIFRRVPDALSPAPAIEKIREIGAGAKKQVKERADGVCKEIDRMVDEDIAEIKKKFGGGK